MFGSVEYYTHAHCPMGGVTYAHARAYDSKVGCAHAYACNAVTHMHGQYVNCAPCARAHTHSCISIKRGEFLCSLSLVNTHTLLLILLNYRSPPSSVDKQCPQTSCQTVAVQRGSTNVAEHISVYLTNELLFSKQDRCPVRLFAYNVFPSTRGSFDSPVHSF